MARIRGNISLLSGGVSSVGGAVWFGIYAIHDDESVPDPSVANDYNENDCLWSYVVNFQTVTLTSVGGWSNPANLIEIDIKAKRKLTSNSIIILAWKATGGSADEQAIFSASIGALLLKT